MDVLPHSPTLALSRYIEKYRIRKKHKKYIISYRMFYDLSNRWYPAAEISGDKAEYIAKYLKAPRTRERILKIANELIERYAYTIAPNKALSMAIREVAKNHLAIMAMPIM